VKNNRSIIIFIAWGETYVEKIRQCLNESMQYKYDLLLITDKNTTVKNIDIPFIRADFTLSGLNRKSEILLYIPKGYKSYLFLDSDTKVIGDIELGFRKAEEHGIAMSPAPHYSLDYYGNFKEIMLKEGVSLQGQMQYNSGVIFFSLKRDVRKVFRLWTRLCKKYSYIIQEDQPFLTLAMEMLKFNPYTLSHSYNYRAFGDIISGPVRIWHSHFPVPNSINSFEYVWPPRRIVRSTIITPEMDEKFLKSIKELKKQI